MSEFEDLEKLLRLKRYERPPEDYYEQFFSDFQARQRSEMLRQSAHGLFFERVSTYLWGFGNRRWLYAGGVAYAAVMIVVFLRPVSEMFAPSSDGADNIQHSEMPQASEKGPAHETELPENGPAPGAIREL